MDRVRVLQCSEKGDFDLMILGTAWWRICSAFKGDLGYLQMGLRKAKREQRSGQCRKQRSGLRMKLQRHSNDRVEWKATFERDVRHLVVCPICNKLHRTRCSQKISEQVGAVKKKGASKTTGA